jgi:predicted NBD/HSP70 family sugar kinase
VTIQIGIDLGGSNLRAAAFGDGDGATPLEIHKEAVGDDRAPDAIVERVARTIEGLAGGSAGPVAVGVGLVALLRDRAGHGRELTAPALARRAVRRAARPPPRRALPARRLQLCAGTRA